MTTSYLTRDSPGMHASNGACPGPALTGAETLPSNDDHNEEGEDLGDIKEFTIDMPTGRIACAVLTFGGMLGLGDKLLAEPWMALTLDTTTKRFTRDSLKASLKDVPGFDKAHWPTMSDQSWTDGLHKYFRRPDASE